MMASPPGDPSGRRPAQKRATLLAEAGRTARLLEVLLQRADFDPATVSELIRQLAEREKIELQSAHGRIESRKRFKPHVSHPLLEQRPRSLLFVDESGQSNSGLAAAPGMRVFSLAGIAMEEEAVALYRDRADDVKRQFFGTTDLTFHEPYMRNREGPYQFNGETSRQIAFDEAIAELVEEIDFVAFGIGVRKDRFVEDFVETGLDPYLPTDVYAVAIIMLLERYIDFLASSDVTRLGRVTFESQGPREDAYHQLEYARALIDGSQWVPDSAFRSWLETGLRFTGKSGSDPMELADMFSRDLFEWVKNGCTGSPKRWDLFSKKVHCRDDGRMGKFGVKVFPDSDIRDRVEEHRKDCGAQLT